MTDIVERLRGAYKSGVLDFGDHWNLEEEAADEIERLRKIESVAEGGMDLNKIKLGHSPLTDTIFLYRHGKDPEIALDKREVIDEVLSVLINYMMHDAPKGSEIAATLCGKSYKIQVTPNTQ